MELFNKAWKHKFLLILILLGILLLLASLLYILAGSGKDGLGPAQILIINTGALLTLLGISFLLGSREDRNCGKDWIRKIPGLPNLLWVLVGLLAAYMIFLILPAFFNPFHRIVYFNRYLPDRAPIGVDLTATLDSIRSWFAEGKSSIYYPALVPLLFAPLLLLPYPLYYYVVATLTVFSFFVLAFIVPLLITDRRDKSIILLIFGVSIFSYGLQFELERGQFHTIAMLLCILAVYLFHRQSRQRFFAYVLFCISVQLKIYPALFIVLLVDDWRDWKTNLKRFAILGVVNFLLLFLLGFTYFSNFVDHIFTLSVVSPEISNVNHSIVSFLNYLLTPGARLLDANAYAWLAGNMGLMTNLFLALFAICFFLVWRNAYRRNCGVDSLLLMVCVLGGLMIPSVNHDYTLPLLTAPFALVVSEEYTQAVPRKLLVIPLLVLSSFVYAITLVPFLRKPPYLQNSFPLLILLLVITTILSLLRDPKSTEAITTAQTVESS
jgi:hypothetical protein